MCPWSGRTSNSLKTRRRHWREPAAAKSKAPSGRSVFKCRPIPAGRATLRLAFCGTHQGCNVEVFVNGRSVGETGTLPSTSAMQRDGIRAYWLEKDITFDASLLAPGANVIQLLSHAHGWSQGVMYDCLRLELDEAARR